MVQKIDEAYRATDEYKAWLATALDRFPALNQSMFDHALACHFGNPKAWRDKKKYPHNPTPPPPSPTDLTLNTVTVEEPSVVQEVETDDHAPVSHAVVCEEVTVSVPDTDGDAPLPELP